SPPLLAPALLASDTVSLHDALPMSGSRTVELAHGLVGEVALARVTPEDRRAMHLALASRLRSPLERARHFVAGDDVDHAITAARSEEHTSELQSRENLVCRLLLEKK